MRTLLFTLFFLALTASSFGQQNTTRFNSPTNPKLDSLFALRNFFQFRDSLQSGLYPIDEKDSLFYYSYLHNFFKDSEASNRCINQLIYRYSNRLTKSRRKLLMKLKIDNYVKEYQYQAAYRANQELLSKCNDQLSVTEKADTRNSINLWKSLQYIAPQTITKNNNTTIFYKRDVAGLITIPVNANKDSSQYFVFDTGANLSVMTESSAKKNQLKLLTETFDVTAITGKKIKARCGVASNFTIGSIELANVVFIIFPDSTLSFGDKYHIDGIIGFPVIEQLEQVHLRKNSTMYVPAVAQDKALNNLGLDELTPIIEVKYNKERLPFTFDTGGQETFLNSSFFDSYRMFVEQSGKLQSLRYGGAGGIDSVKSYELATVELQVANKPIALTNISVKTSPVSPKELIYYGNLGQDALNKFDEVIINFKYMYVDVKP